ncbi:MAG: hypothetical protein QME79_12170 [Bacillota bacterium]|nr:hypothetical protein [Bacillota bacterium]
MTEADLLKEKGSFVTVFWLNVASDIYLIFADYRNQPVIPILVLLVKILAMYYAFRMSRFLKQSGAITILYTVFALFALLDLVPFVGLVSAANAARRQLQASGTSSDGR